ncbi:Piso0_002135 [Millerozyma farinosa CBS 7064]|uniref:Piso0_002135 protein n=1 Tax=Pichia sorbitophila (strain ATCC MYA-4447 / BCRC 22081 / CBS 7064 / NBRC 10061 / NRRL Y-12695) TaxID=559304 RepID=G8YBS9_PICSO|nr:Piso0_002135 [Millerozyma farinosa CBS 7064]
MDGDNYELIRITDQALIDRTRHLNSEAWKGPLTTEEYTEREYVLGKSNMIDTGDNGIYVFALVDKSRRDDFLCSSELLVRKSFKLVWSEETKSVVNHTVLSGCIGGVFTPQVNRGKGYARIMINKLVELSKQKYLGEDGFLTLYSEVGDYYSKSGFTSLPVPLLKMKVKDINETALENVKIEPIKYHTFDELLDRYGMHLTHGLEQKVANDHKERVVVEPVSEIVDWFHLRAKFVASKLMDLTEKVRTDVPYQQLVDQLTLLKPNMFGLKLTSVGGDFIGFIAWTYDWKQTNVPDHKYAGTATVLKLFISPEYDQLKYSKYLFSQAMGYFANNGGPGGEIGAPVEEVVVWDSEVDEPIKQWLTDKYAPRVVENGSISAILLMNDHEQKLFEDGKLVWEENTKLPWF